MLNQELSTTTAERARQIGAPNGVLRKVAVLIPAYNPDCRLPEFVAQLLERGFGAVLVVNDGSDACWDSLYQNIAAIPACTVIPHPGNLGKGRALKTGLNNFLLHYPAFIVVVPSDA